MRHSPLEVARVVTIEGDCAAARSWRQVHGASQRLQRQANFSHPAGAFPPTREEIVLCVCGSCETPAVGPSGSDGGRVRETDLKARSQKDFP